jgi:hypothetical protein
LKKQKTQTKEQKFNKTKHHTQKKQTIRKNNLIKETKYNNKEQNINRELKLIEENDEEVSQKKTLTKGIQSDIIPGHNDWYTIEKGKPIAQTKQTTKKVTLYSNKKDIVTQNNISQTTEQQHKINRNENKNTTPTTKTQNQKPQMENTTQKPNYHLPPPPAKLYHRLGTPIKTKKRYMKEKLVSTQQ